MVYIIRSIIEFNRSISQKGAIIALDMGLKRTGIAISDTDQVIGSPYQVLDHKTIGEAIAKIAQLTQTHACVAIVIGYPLEMSGREGEACKKMLGTVELLLKKVSLPIYLHDERFSTNIADKALREYGYSRLERSKRDDKVAASYMLQTVLDQLKLERGNANIS